MNQSFKISPRILAHLGADLIKNESIALLELAKNSYDACANSCTVLFVAGNDGKIKEIQIEDNGFGMSEEIVTKVYLTLGTDYKLKRKIENSCGRVPLGEKGIGRLGIHKLGNEIELITKAASEEEVHLSIDWNQLDYVTDIGEFTIPVTIVTPPSHFKTATGTKIIIRDLKNSWSNRALRQVYRDLMSLNTPFAKGNDSFKVIVESNNQNVFARLPDFEKIKDASLYIGHCRMEGSKIVEFNYEFKPWKSLSKVDEGRSLKFQDLKNYELRLVDSQDHVIDLDDSGIGPIEFDLLIYELSAEVFSLLDTERKSIRDYLRENGGIRVYRDGMRVYNYGEQDNDWLGLDRRRIGRFAGNVGNGMVIGSALLEGAYSRGLKEKSNREGFIENESYDKFLAAIEYALSLIVRERNVDKHRLTTLYRKHKVIEPVLSDLNELIDLVEEQVTDTDTKSEILKYLNRINTQYGDVKDILIKSANAGLNLASVVHEVEKLISQLSGSIKRNENDIALGISNHLETIIRNYATMIKRSDIRKDEISEIVKTVLTTLKYRFKDHEIEVFTNYDSNSIEAFFAISEAVSVLNNIIDNAIFWLKYARKKNRRLSVFITDILEFEGVKYHSIIVSDNGPGFNIPADVAINPFMTGKPNGIGSGLGLHVANEMMKGMKGRLDFLELDDFDLPDYITEKKITKAIIAISFPINKS